MLNYAYHFITSGMNNVERAQLDASLTDPSERDAAIARQNTEAMKQLAGFGIAPPPTRQKRDG